MGWKDEYRNKTVTPDEAVSIVRDGDRVVIPLTEQPLGLVSALINVSDRLDEVAVCVSTPAFDIGALLSAGLEVEVEIFLGPLAREYENSGASPFLPLPLSLTFKTNDERPNESKPIDVAVVTVTPPDANGMVSFGPQPWSKIGYARRADRVIAEVNPNLIDTYGDCFMHISEFDLFVEAQKIVHTRETLRNFVSGFEEERRIALEEIIDLVSPERLGRMAPRLQHIDIQILRSLYGLEAPSDVIVAIGENVRPIIKDGACIQIGVGSPSTYLPQMGVFDERLDLGLHTELTVPGIAKLVDAGVINGKRKNLHIGKAVAVAWSGSDDRDLDIIDGNPNFELYEPKYLLNPYVISSNSGQVSINNALSVDLTGQICSESVFGGKMVNGIGGQPETHLGALYSEGGRAITLLQSTALNGAVSRIVPKLAEGELVTIPRFWADTVITEYGRANLLGKNHRERAQALIEIAHPDFRKGLKQAVPV